MGCVWRRLTEGPLCDPFSLFELTLWAANGKSSRQNSHVHLSTRLRTGEPKLFPRVHEGRVLIDVRTIFPDEDAGVVTALRAVAPSAAGKA